MDVLGTEEININLQTIVKVSHSGSEVTIKILQEKYNLEKVLVVGFWSNNVEVRDRAEPERKESNLIFK